MGLQTFPKSIHRDVLRECSTVGKRRPEKLNRRWSNSEICAVCIYVKLLIEVELLITDLVTN